MPRPASQPYFNAAFKPRLIHGGDTSRGRRKLSRPIDAKRAMHIVFRSGKALGPLSFLHPKQVRGVDETVHRAARQYGIRLYQYANSGTHLHLLAKGRTRTDIQNFLRAIGSRVAQLVTGARKGHAFGKFWDALAFSRIVGWGRAFTEVQYYVLKNQLEAEGYVEHERGRRRPGRGSSPPPYPKEWET